MLAFFLSPLGRYIAAGLGAVALLSGFVMRERNIGAAKAVAKIEKATNNAIDKGNGKSFCGITPDDTWVKNKNRNIDHLFKVSVERDDTTWKYLKPTPCNKCCEYILKKKPWRKLSASKSKNKPS